jgi:pSer/pThr/pTyr-binding forkhead associated (FHA) protein
MFAKTMISNTRLAVYKGSKLDLALPVTEVDTTIGRDDGNALQLPDPQVSKRHAVIRAKGGGWTIEDLNSTNGITVNGERVERSVLKNGDRIHIGPFELVFESAATDEWVPSLVIDMSSKVAHQTIVQAPKGPPAGFGDRRG